MTSIEVQYRLFQRWLEDEALPFQDRNVRDLNGFHERMSPHGKPLDLERRARVSARQLFAFSKLMELGVGDDVSFRLACHARDYLLAMHIREDGCVLPVAGGQGSFDLYDVAFCLFGLAAAPEVVLTRTKSMALAAKILDRLQSGWRHPRAGFEEGNPRSLPLRANPHMHMLEASLEWMSTGPHDERFQDICKEIVGLCLSHFIDPASGAVRELYDGDWNVLKSRENDVEPGHQFEWGWLLLRWSVLVGDRDVRAAGERMIGLAESRGINAAGLACSLISPELEVTSSVARLWPQTERVKAWSVLARMLPEEQATPAMQSTTKACEGLLRFFRHPVSGSWWENIDDTGTALIEPSRTSSFYHIVGAFSELAKFVSKREFQSA